METPSAHSVDSQLKKIAVVAAILVVAVAMLVYTLSHRQIVPNDSDNFTNSSFSREAVVAVTKDGFEPATLTISPHTRVTWKSSDNSAHVLLLNNEDQKDGPATDPNNDPQLPNDRQIGPGSSPTHVFEKAGIYKFHDQVNPTANVSITVN